MSRGNVERPKSDPPSTGDHAARTARRAAFGSDYPRADASERPAPGRRADNPNARF